jgi:hypothetical protein
VVRPGDDPLLDRRPRRDRERALHEAVGRFVEKASIEVEGSARGGGGGGVDAGAVQGGAARGVDVGAGAREDDRMTGGGAVEADAGGRCASERDLVPPAAQDPAAAGGRVHAARDHGVHRVERSRPAQVDERRLELADLPDVDVGVVEAGEDGAAAEVHPPRAGRDRSFDVGPAADGRDPPVHDRHRLRRGPPIQGVEAGAVEEEVGAHKRSGLRHTMNTP